MRTTRLIMPSALALVLGAACGSSGESSSNSTPANTSDITTYQQLATNVQNGATTYRTTMMAPTTTVADCRRVHDAYDAQVRPWVSRMVQMRGAMDQYMNNHGGASVADFSCTSATMMYELDRHRTAACTSADISANRTEASGHVDAMLSYGGHMWDRCNQMMRGTNAGNWSWGSMMSGCETWDGHCSGMMHDACCQGPGGMMGQMHGSCDW